jgi:succinyl-CoA synthetase beta subunit
MVRGSLGKLASRALSVAGRWQHQQLRRLNIHEYQVPSAPRLALCPPIFKYCVGFIRAILEAGTDGLGFVDCLGLHGAELMGKYGINVPRGAAAGSVHEVKDALKNMFPSEKEVMTP